MKIFAQDLVDFLNRDFGAANMACIDMTYLGQFTTLTDGKFNQPASPDAVIDTDDLNCVVVNVTLQDKIAGEPPFSLPVVTLVRLLRLVGVRDATTTEAPSLRAHPTLGLS